MTSGKYKIEIRYNKHVSDHGFYFRHAGIDHNPRIRRYRYESFTFSKQKDIKLGKLNYTTIVEAENEISALLKVMTDRPFTSYFACKYREYEYTMNAIVDPTNTFGTYIHHISIDSRNSRSGPRRLEKFFSDHEPDFSWNYSAQFKALKCKEIREQFTVIELAMLDAYASESSKWHNLCMQLNQLYHQNNMKLNLSNDELRKLIDVETKYGNIYIEKVN